MRSNNPSILFTALTHANFAAIVAKVIARSSTRVVVSERNVPSACFRSLMQKHFFLTGMRCLYPLTAKVVCVSEGVKKDLESIGISKHLLQTIYNPIDLGLVSRLCSEQVAHPWITNRTEQILVAVGRLSQQKDYPTLFQAFRIVRQHRKVRLIILGVGDKKESLLDLASSLGIRESIDFVGFQNNPFKWLAASDLYVLSSQFEGLPGSLIQALACGARVVSTDCNAGPSEILENGKWGRLVKVGDFSAMAAAIIATLDDPNPPDTLMRAKQFSLAIAITEYKTCFGLI